MKKVAFHNLGCKVNSYELDVMQQILEKRGYSIVPFEELADIYVINTCTVTNIADRKSRQMLHRAKQKNPQGIVVAVGCYVQTDQEGAVRDDSVDLVIGNNRKKDIALILEDFLDRWENRDGVGKTDMPQAAGNASADMQAAGSESFVGAQAAGSESLAGAQAAGPGSPGDAPGAGSTPAGSFAADKTLSGTTVIDVNAECGYEEMTLEHTAEHTRAYIKIQDGCNQFCSYCVIPFARGRVRSRREEDIIREIQGLAAAGYQEVVLTGIHISSYGIDFEGKKVYQGESRLIDLVEHIHAQSEGIRRIRLGSLEPRIVTEDVVKRLAALPKVCPHFHLSLQSGCDEVLKRMNRHYTTGEYLEGVRCLRKYFKHPAITTDVIVGFPGETVQEFEETREFLAQVGFFEMHIFKYSRRSGTAADRMPGQLTDQEKSERSDELFGLEQEQSRAFRSDYIGTWAEVLWEERREIGRRLYFVGHTKHYVKVALPTDETEELSNTISLVYVRGFLTDDILLAKPEEPQPKP